MIGEGLTARHKMRQSNCRHVLAFKIPAEWSRGNISPKMDGRLSPVMVSSYAVLSRRNSTAISLGQWSVSASRMSNSASQDSEWLNNWDGFLETMTYDEVMTMVSFSKLPATEVSLSMSWIDNHVSAITARRANNSKESRRTPAGILKTGSSDSI